MLKKRYIIPVVILFLLLSIIIAIYWPQQHKVLGEWVYLSRFGDKTFGKTYDRMPDNGQELPEGACIYNESYDVPCHADGNGVLLYKAGDECEITAGYDYGYNQLYIVTPITIKGDPTFMEVSVRGDERSDWELPGTVVDWFVSDRSNVEEVAAKLNTKYDKEGFARLIRQITRFETKLGGMKIPGNCNMVLEHFKK